MPLALYVDENTDGAAVRGLRRRGVDVLTIQEDGRRGAADNEVLDRATSLGRVLLSFDRHFLAEAGRRQEGGLPFAGVIRADPDRVTIGTLVRDLELMATILDPGDLDNQVAHLPL